MNKVYERGQHGTELTQCMGESGFGMYAIVPPNPVMRRYYTANGENLFRFRMKATVVDLTKEELRVIRYVRHGIDAMAKNTPGYTKPRVNKQNYQRFPHAITEYMAKKHPEAAGFIVPHKLKGSNLPGGKQLVVTDMSAIEIIKKEEK